MPSIQLSGVTVAFGGPPVLDGIDLSIESGERLCVLGRNGAGKSTLLKVVLGQIEPDAGRVARATGTRVAILEQQVPAGLDGTVLEAVLARGASDAGQAPELHVANAAISRVGLSADTPVSELSAGLKRRALLARAWAAEPDILLLDEPTNHLDIESITWLEEFLQRQGGSLLFVTHDRAFLRRLATGILDLDRGQLVRHGSDYDRYAERKRHGLDVEARGDALFDKQLAQEERWVRQGVRERRKRNQGRVRRLESMRDQRGSRRTVPQSVRIEAQAAAPSGRLVLRTTGLSYAWGEKRIVHGLETEILRGDRVGILGPNGSGKTTLMRLLLGELEPDAGRVRHGVNLEIAYFDQLHATLDEDASLADNVSGGTPSVCVNGRTRHIIAYLQDFLFSADQVHHPVRILSGGERNRVLLARLFARPSNVLVLDEPTNDLDVETLEVLEDLLTEYEGTILLVSHDRELLDHVVTSTLVMGGDGHVGEFVGGYSDWARQNAAQALSAREAKKQARRGRTSKPPKPAPVLSREERRELHDLPTRIEQLEAQQASLHQELADPAFFRQEGAVIAEAKGRLEELGGLVNEAYARWEELEEKRTRKTGEAEA